MHDKVWYPPIFAQNLGVRRIGRIGQRFIRWWTPLRLAGVALLVLAFLVGILGYLNEHGGLHLQETPRRILAYLSANVSTELASIAITMLFVDALYQHRETEREKRRLILQMGSPDNAFAQEAVRALRSRGWLGDGSLKIANLWGANLQGAILIGANLQRADLQGAEYNYATTWPEGFTPPPEAVNVDAQTNVEDGE